MQINNTILEKMIIVNTHDAAVAIGVGASIINRIKKMRKVNTDHSMRVTISVHVNNMSALQ